MVTEWLAEQKARLEAYLRYRYVYVGREGHDGCLCDECVAAITASHDYLEKSPDDLARCHAEIERLQAEKASLRQQLAAAREVTPEMRWRAAMAGRAEAHRNPDTWRQLEQNDPDVWLTVMGEGLRAALAEPSGVAKEE